MTDTSTEASHLLKADEHTHTTLFDRLDAQCDKNHIFDQPPCKDHRNVKYHLTQATSPAGHGHPVHHHLQSPALLQRLEQAAEHGFSTVFCAIKSFFKTKRREAVHLTTDTTYRTVSAVFIVAILTMVSMTALGPTLLLFMNNSGFTSSSDITAYMVASALNSGVPIFSNIGLGVIASRFGPGHALSIGSTVSAFGVLIVMVSSSSLLLFFIGYALFSISNSLRVIRVSILSKIVPENERTTVFATHALMTPIGALMGPIIWIIMQSYRGSVTLIDGVFDFNRFTLDYAVVCTVLFSISAIAYLLLADVEGDHQQESTDGVSGNIQESEVEVVQEVTIHFTNGGEEVVHLDRYRNRVFRYFCGIMFGVNLSAGLYMTAFQPVLVNVFHTSDAKLGLIFELIAAFAILPPLLVALLSRYLMDRHILLIGLASKILGMTLFLPVFGPVKEWQIILGFMLIVKASIFFSTASMSLFTKVLGKMSTSSLLGVLASASNIGPAFAQILLADHVVRLFGSFGFGVFAIPAIVSLALIVYPTYWKRLDPAREFTRILMMETQNHRIVA